MWELLAPAGSYESIRAAVNAGADAVYAGGRLFGARAYADNPNEEQLIRGLEYCHLHGRKLYLTVNTLLKEQELETKLEAFLLPYYENGLDGVIVQDFGVLRYVRERFPELPVHASTQMTVTSSAGVRLLQSEGVSRVVPARELSLEEIRRIIEETGAEVETFIHGAMCYSYSGQCLFSSLLGGRSGNRGRCAQPCRLPYRVAGGEQSSAYLLSMKDMCTLDILPELLETGITSLKIEGRMKRPEYTAGVVSVYRKYLNIYEEAGRDSYRVDEDDQTNLLDLYNRGGFSEGYYHTSGGRHMMSLYRPNHMGTRAAEKRSGNDGRRGFVALESLRKGDVLELAPGKEITLREDIRKGETLRLAIPKDLRVKGAALFRVKNEQLLQQLKEQYVDREIREKISGTLSIPANGPAVLTLTCAGERIECSRQIAQPAQNRPTGPDSVQRQMRKTGNTAFEFEELEITLADGLFLPIAGLNELRRTGLELLEKKILERSRRDGKKADESACVAGKRSGAELSAAPEQCKGEPGLRVNLLVTDEGQLRAVLGSGIADIDTICLDSMLFAMLSSGDEEDARKKALELIENVKGRGWNCFLSCPGVLRDRERKFLSGRLMRTVMREMDGFLLHTIDELSYFKEYVAESGSQARLAADDGLYAYNRRALAFLRSHGVTRFTLPAELNYRELSELGTEDAELNVYGYQPVMQSAQCVQKNSASCTGTPKVIRLRDRKNAEFPVLSRCPFCRNTIYNSVPLMLCGCRAEIAKLAPSYLRLSFTVETEEETERILRGCMRLLSGDGDTEGIENTGTRGHFRRGVE